MWPIQVREFDDILAILLGQKSWSDGGGGIERATQVAAVVAGELYVGDKDVYRDGNSSRGDRWERDFDEIFSARRDGEVIVIRTRCNTAHGPGKQGFEADRVAKKFSKR